jgi:tRNA(Ile)-lysidine synthase
LAGGLQAERTHREIRLSVGPVDQDESSAGSPSAFEVPIPGETEIPEFGLHIKIQFSTPLPSGDTRTQPSPAILRSWKAGDRVRLRYSSGPRKVKEVLERMKVTGAARPNWPVLEHAGRIIWMRGIELEPEPGIQITVTPLDPDPEPQKR